MCAQSGACGPDFREAKTPRTLNRKTRLGRRVCIPAEAGKISATGIERFPEFAEIRKPLWRAPMKCAQNQPLPGGLRCNPGGPFALIRPCHLCCCGKNDVHLVERQLGAETPLPESL